MRSRARQPALYIIAPDVLRRLLEAGGPGSSALTVHSILDRIPDHGWGMHGSAQEVTERGDLLGRATAVPEDHGRPHPGAPYGQAGVRK